MTDLASLLQAKEHSDQGRYQAKHQILRRLIFRSPNSFSITDQSNGITGVQHDPTMFRLHVPTKSAPELSKVRKKTEMAKAAELIPPHLVTTALGGLLGTGIGYGAGTLIENIVPEGNLEKGKLRRNLAMLGGGLGVLPGIWSAHRDGRLSQQEGGSYWDGALGRDRLFGSEKKSSLEIVQYLRSLRAGLSETFGVQMKEASLSKSAEGFFEPLIPANRFMQATWEDPLSPLPLKLTTTALVQQASENRMSPFVSPADIARVAVGMGTGITSAATVGSVIGLLAGLTPEAQKTLQQAGLWYGAIRGALSGGF